jgi:hypothetical protein
MELFKLFDKYNNINRFIITIEFLLYFFYYQFIPAQDSYPSIILSTSNYHENPVLFQNIINYYYISKI